MRGEAQTFLHVNQVRFIVLPEFMLESTLPTPANFTSYKLAAYPQRSTFS